MRTIIKEKAGKLVNIYNAFKKVGFLAIEGKTDFKQKIVLAKKNLADLGYKEYADYIEVMDALS